MNPSYNARWGETLCSTGAAHTIKDVIGMVKCKSAYSKERIPTFTEYASYDAKNFNGKFVRFFFGLPGSFLILTQNTVYIMRSINQAPLFDFEGYPTVNLFDFFSWLLGSFLIFTQNTEHGGDVQKMFFMLRAFDLRMWNA